VPASNNMILQQLCLFPLWLSGTACSEDGAIALEICHQTELFRGDSESQGLAKRELEVPFIAFFGIKTSSFY
jgi:hypothetical protein